VLSPAAADTVSSKVSPTFNEPERMAAPRVLTTGIGSPVNADSSIVAALDVTTPSTGTTSPARTISWSPIATADIGTSSM
jgi:hypothetical protein